MAQVSGDSGRSIAHSATFANDRVCLFDAVAPFGKTCGSVRFLLTSAPPS